MQCIMKDVLYLDERTHDYTDKDTGEVRTYAKVTLQQEGSPVMEVSLDPSMLGQFVRLETYDLLCRVSTYDRRFSFKVIGFAEC